jgi:hypothetical protein
VIAARVIGLLAVAAVQEKQRYRDRAADCISSELTKDYFCESRTQPCAAPILASSGCLIRAGSCYACVKCPFSH